jgi:filamentous hemagglutinin family protein
MFKHAALNRIYRLVWSHARQAHVAVAETAKGRGKQGTRRKLLLALALTPPLALGAPSGGEVIAGSGRITQQGATTRIQQDSAKLSLNWQGFNVGAEESVVFAQPDANSVAVNRIYDPDASQILGHLSANGQVYLINPNGVLFGRGATVDVGGLVASTLDLQGTDSKGTHFAGSGQGSVVNEGAITAAPGGYVALLGNKVSNTGTVSAQLGTVAMGAGSAVTLKFEGSTLAQLQVDQSVLKSTVENGGLVQANGGQVLISAGAAESLLASVVNNTGVVEAQTVQQHGSKIVLLSGMNAGTTTVAGKLDASAPNGGNGGFIETSGAQVKVADDASVTTAAPLGLAGTWLIDPHDFTVSATATGSVTAGTPDGDISGATLSTALGSGNVTILSAQGSNASGQGNINVNDDVSWSANTLTLTAAHDINVNALMTATGTSTLELNTATANGADSAVAGGAVNMGINDAGFTGRIDFGSRSGSGFLRVNANGYTIINSLGAQGSTSGLDLQGMNGNLGGHYALGSNIDATATASWHAGAGFAPVGGDAASPFTGSFQGLGHTISGLSINRPTTNGVGLFGATDAGAAISNLGVVDGRVTGNSRVGGLVGVNYGAVTATYVTGDVRGLEQVGGLVGINSLSGALTGTYATGAVSGTGSFVGGLVGYNQNAGLINSHATGIVRGGHDVGGLVGYTRGSALTNIYATGNVSGSNGVGGLVGRSDVGSALTDAYATGNVNGNNAVGGLVGQMIGTLTNVSAMGEVSGTQEVGGLVGSHSGTLITASASGEVHGTADYVGGLVGYNNFGTMTHASASGGVSGNRYVGGLVGGNNAGTIANSAASGDVSGADYVGGLAGFNCFGAACASTLTASYATGAVSGNGSVGGLVGYNFGILNTAYATGAVNGTAYFVGGLVGENRGSVTNTYATGPVTGGGDVGGLVGGNHGTLTNAYATGLVRGSGLAVGGLVGNNALGTIISSYWNTTTTALSTSSGGTGLTTAQMMSLASFASWNTASPDTISPNGGSGATWRIYEGHTSPLLTAFLTALDLSQTVTYDGTTQQLEVPAGVVTATAASGTTAGRYLGDYYSTQQGYDITGLTLTIAKRALTSPAIANVTAVYGDAIAPGAVSWGNLVPGDEVIAAVSVASPAFSSSGNLNAGSYRQTASATLTGADSDNYSFAGYTTPGTNYTVSPLSLTGSIAAGTSVYGSPLAPGTASFTNVIANDVLGTATVSVNTSGNTSTGGKLKAGSYTGIEFVSALSGVDGSNYTFATLRGDYTVIPLALTGAAIAPAGSVYGAAVSPGAVSWTNPVAGDRVSAGVTLVSPLLSSSGKLKAGSYFQTASSVLSGDDATNYRFAGFTTSAANYTVTQRALSEPSIASAHSVYGAALAPGAVSWGNLVLGDAVSAAVSLASPMLSASLHVSVGTYRQTASATLTGTDSDNYSFAGYTTPSAEYTVTPLALTGSITTGTSAYGSPLAPGAATFTNAFETDALSTATVSVNITGRTSTSGNLRAGSYTGIQSVSALSGPDAANYSFANLSGDYAVSKRALTGSIAAGSSIYGSPLAPGPATFTNALANDLLGIATVAVNTNGRTSTSGHLKVGSFNDIESIGSLSGPDGANYSSEGLAGDYTVTPLGLNASGIAAVTSVYGAAPAVGAVSWRNLLDGDRVSSAVSIVLRAFSTSGNLRVGSYRQMAAASLSDTDAGNYSFAGYTTPSANYTVSKRVLTGSIAKGTSIYGNALGLGTVTFTNALPRDVLGTATRALATAGRTSTSGKLKAGTYSASQSISALSGPDAANYDFSTVKGDYTVTKRALTGSIAQGTSKFRAVLKPGSATFTNKITNDALGKVVVGVNTTGKLKGGFLPAGTYPGIEFIKSLSGVDAVNYTFANVKGNYKVTP